MKKVLKNAATIATFAYDPLGRRVEKVAGGTTTTFTYDAEDILREIAGATTTYYVHGPGIDEPLAKEVSGSSTYYHAEGLGSVLKVTNASGSVTHEYRYDAYGKIEAGSTQAGYSFTGREWDPESGLFYYRARYFDPAMGRFISEDPIGIAAGANFYSYALSNPVDFTDPFGLEVWPEHVPNGPVGGAVGCFLTGVAVGMVAAAAVVAAALAAEYVGVSMAAITTTLGVVGTVGAAMAGYEAISDYATGNYDGLAYTAGGVLGGALVGGVAAQAGVFPGVDPNAPWTFGGGKGFKRNPDLPLGRDRLNWISTGVDKASGTGVAGLAGGGAASGKECDCK